MMAPARELLVSDVCPSALPLSDGAGTMIVLPFTVVFTEGFVDGRADADALGAVEVLARTVGRVDVVCRGFGVGLLDGGG